MVFKRPRNSRDDRSGRSVNRVTNVGDRQKSSSSSRGNTSPGLDQTDNSRSDKKHNSSKPGERKAFSSQGNKPYSGRFGGDDKPASSFSGGAGEKRAFSPRNKPYTGRPADNDDSPKRSPYNRAGGGDSGSYAPRKKPYSGRITEGDDKPKKNAGSFRADSRSQGDKKPFVSKSKFSPGSPGGESRPKRNTDDYNGGTRRRDEEKPKRAASANKDYNKRESAKTHRSDRPQRANPSYDRITPDLDAPVKTLRGRKKAVEPKDSGLIRLNRYISNAGICSRRKADELIAAGVVSVNGVVVSELGHKVDPQKDEIRYNGELLKREKMVYVLLNKPKDYITTTEDPQERRTVMHLVEKASRERIYPIGRLDRNTTGLLLMTNDGDLADKLSHPKNNIVKLYQVELNKSLTQGDLNKIAFGLELEDGLIKPDSISYVAGGSKREIGIQIHSGKNRIVRRIFEYLGYEVVKLDRAVYANLTKKDLPRGRWRYLEESEVIQLKHLI